MTISRDLGTIPVGRLQSNTVDWFYFVKIEIASPVGTKRFTNRHTDYTGDIDGSSQTWVAEDMQCGGFGQGKQGALRVAKLSFANLDYTWTNWANSPGLRKTNVSVWRGEFNPADGLLDDAILIYVGTIDSHQCGERANLAIKPWRSTWGRKVVTAIPGLSPLLPAPLMPKDGELIRWNTGFVGG